MSTVVASQQYVTADNLRRLTRAARVCGSGPTFAA